MLIVIGYDLPDNWYNEQMSKDMEPTDLLDSVNDLAIDFDARHHVWHLSEDAHEEFDKSMEALYADFSMPKTREVIDRC